MSRGSTKRLRLCSGNPRYFEYDGRPIWLSGHSRLWTLTGFIPQCYDVIEKNVEDTGRHHSDRTYIDEVERVAESGGHLFRMTPFWPDAWKLGKPMPWEPVGVGRFDLSKFDDEYFRAFRDFMGRCAENDIIVQLELWDRPGLSHWHPSRWPAHPFNPDHNVNYSGETLPGGDGHADIVFGRRLFYSAVGGERPELFKLQRLYIERLLDEAGPFPNVIYCIENEGTGGIEWESEWAGLVRDKVPDALVTAMPLEGDDHTWRRYFDDPAFNCLDGGGSGLRYATNSDVPTHEHFGDEPCRLRGDRFALIRETMAKYCLLMEYEPEKARPVYVSNCFLRHVDNLWGLFCAGGAGLRYHRRLWEESETCYRWVRAFSDFLEETKADFARMTPANHLVSGKAVCLAHERAAVVYLPTDKEVVLSLPESAAKARVRMFDCDQGGWLSDETVEPEAASGAAKGRAIRLRADRDTGVAAFLELY